MTDYLPKGYTPPIYTVATRQELYLWVSAFLIVVGWILLPLMLAQPGIMDGMLYLAGLGAGYYQCNRAVEIFRFNRELKDITRNK